MTEETSPRYADLDIWPTQRIIEDMQQGQRDAVAAIAPSVPAIAKAADAAAERIGQTGRLIYVGAGTSGRLAVLDGSELGPTFGWPHDRLEYAMAGGLAALTRSQEGAEDSSADGRAIMRSLDAGHADIVICVAASGRTPYTLGALEQAKSQGALTVGISNNPDTALLVAADYPILAETGAEIIAGSTRMKAGTAQKIILNMLSTAIMTRLGHVYRGLMVDMVVSNDKLAKRAVSMVSELSGCSTDEARAALARTDNHIKTAVLLCRGVGLDAAAALLDASDGNLRTALDSLREQ